MARNEEKAQSMLYRFRKAMQHADSEGWRNPHPEEPLLPSTCQSIPAALHARRELMKELSRKITRIQDPELDEAAIRSLNDELNQLVRLRKQWDETLRALGYKERDKTMRWGQESLPEPGNAHGYLYFGRAKQLPGVQEILNPRKEQNIRIPARILAMQETADEEYFGILPPEEEESLWRREAEAEEKCRGDGETTLSDWVTGLPIVLPPTTNLPPCIETPETPTVEQVESFLIEKRRQDLLKRYTD